MTNPSITEELCRGLRELCGSPRRSAALPRRVLVVDDDVDDARLIQTALTGAGCEVSTARTGELAESMVKAARPYTRIFLDLSLPAGKSGVEVLSSIREMAPLTPITIVTGYVSPELIGAAQAIQCEVIDKFTEVEKLREALVRAMG